MHRVRYFENESKYYNSRITKTHICFEHTSRVVGVSAELVRIIKMIYVLSDSRKLCRINLYNYNNKRVADNYLISHWMQMQEVHL